MSNQVNNPITAAKAIAQFVQDGWTRGSPCAYRGLMYVPIKVGGRSPITVYEATRGQFDGDCQVLVCVSTTDKGLEPLRKKLASFAKQHDLVACEDPGDSRKKGFKMTCTQVIMALEGAVSVVSDHKPKAKQEAAQAPAQQPASQAPAQDPIMARLELIKSLTADKVPDELIALALKG